MDHSKIFLKIHYFQKQISFKLKKLSKPSKRNFTNPKPKPQALAQALALALALAPAQAQVEACLNFAIH